MEYSNSKQPVNQQVQGQRNDQAPAIAQFVDNRASSTAQLQMQRMMNAGSKRVAQRKIQASIKSPVTAIQRAITGTGGYSGDAVVQCAVDPVISTKNAKEYTIVAQGSPSDFQGGGGAVDTGIGNVQGYNANISSTIKKNKLGNKFTTGAPFTDESGEQDNTKQGFARGHIVGNAIGGPGKPENIFEQDAGQNNSGEWKSFEKRAKNLIEGSHDESEITYEATLTSDKLKYWI